MNKYNISINIMLVAVTVVSIISDAFDWLHAALFLNVTLACIFLSVENSHERLKRAEDILLDLQRVFARYAKLHREKAQRLQESGEHEFLVKDALTKADCNEEYVKAIEKFLTEK